MTPPTPDVPAMKQFLIVDDSAVIRKVARRILEGFSLQVSEAESGEDALALCRDAMPDAILLDVAMPSMDGIDTLRALRALPGGAEATIVLCTLENDLAQRTRARHAGASETIMKPFDRTSMLAKLQDVGVIQSGPT